jgi:hypothetical protein
MEEQLLFARIHDALDVPTPPGAYERLRMELTKKAVRPFRWPALQTRSSNMGFRFAAGLAIVAIAVAAAAAVLAIHNSTNNTSPAGPRMSIQAYQQMVANDNASALAAYSSPCDLGKHSGCGADATRAMPVVQRWINDVSRPDIPTRFVVISAEMRQHLIQNLAAQRELLAASQANDVPAMDRAYNDALYAVYWTGVVIPAITASHQVDATRYAALVGSEIRTLDGCGAACGFTPASATCAKGDGIICQYYFLTVANSFASFQADLIKEAAPSSLAAKDAKIQSDFTQADAVMIAAYPAVVVNDQAAFNSAIAQLERVKTQLDQDAAKITG